jgi:Flp pilus assembly protein TadG
MLRSLRARFRSMLTRARLAREGTVSIEFAFLSPLLLVTLIGGTEVSQAVIAERRLASSVRTSADLIAQTPPNEVLTSQSIDEVFAAARAIMSPYPTTTLKFTISRVDVVSRNNVLEARTVWSVTRNGGTARPCTLLTRAANSAPAAPTTFPAGMHYVGRFIVTDASYVYRAPFSSGFLSAMPGGGGWSASREGIEINSTSYLQTRGDSSAQLTGVGACPAI